MSLPINNIIIKRAIGDCSTIEQQKLLTKFLEHFQEGDKDLSGTLDFIEFKNLIGKYQNVFPQIEDYGKKLQDLFIEADTNKVRKNSGKILENSKYFYRFFGNF